MFSDHEPVWTTMRHLIDVGAAAAVIGTIAGWLPALAAFFAIIWYALNIYVMVRGLRVKVRD